MTGRRLRGAGARRAIGAHVAAFLLLCPGGASAGISSTPLEVRDGAGKEIALFRESHALVIGASDYTAGWPDLPGVARDIASIERVLAAQGFEVDVVRDPNAEMLAKAYREFIGRHGLDPGSRLLFWFAGHGHTEKKSYGGDMGYLVPTDAPLPEEDRAGFLSKAVSMQQIEVYARTIDARHALFLFDSCFSGQLFSTSRAVPEHISYKTALPVRQFITSGSADEQVPDRSVFREQFEEALGGEADRNRDGYVTGTELGEYLQEKVMYYMRKAQHPQYGKIRDAALDKGDFVFQIAAAQAARPGVSGASTPRAAAPQQPVPAREAQAGRDDLGGLWRCTFEGSGRLASLQFELGPEGRGVAEGEEGDGAWWSDPLHWKLDGAVLILTYGGATQRFRVLEAAPRHLLMRGEGGDFADEELHFVRFTEAELPAARDARPEQLVGTWREAWTEDGKDGWNELRFSPGGKGEEKGEEGDDRWKDSFRWFLEAGRLRLELGGETRTYRVRRLTPEVLELVGTSPDVAGEGSRLRKTTPLVDP